MSLSNEALRFGSFLLDPAERRLTRDGVPVELTARYMDALLLMAGHSGQLVTKDRFMAEVWRGVPVTDEALTQCIRTLRRALGDEAAAPSFIETVPRHGYRFIAEVQTLQEHRSSRAKSRGNEEGSFLRPAHPGLRSALLLAAAGLAGGGAAGLVGGIGYGLIAAGNPPPGTGAISVVLVLTSLCLLVGLLGGLGIGTGIALGRLLAPARLFPLMAGGALGGGLVGAAGRLLGLDTFSLLVATRPAAITGGSEGLLLGALAGAAAWVALRHERTDRAALAGAGLGAAGGLLVTLGGGQMMAGSLAALAAAHPNAPLGTLLGGGLPTWLLPLSAAAEGAIFLGALATAFALARRSLSSSPRT